MPSRVKGTFTTTFLCILAKTASLHQHLVGFGRHHFRADIAVDEVADPPDLLLQRNAFFCDQGRIGGNAVDDAPARARLQLVEIGGVQKKFHHSSLFALRN